MIQEIINKLIIIAGQWKQFGEKQYEYQFENTLKELQEATELTRGCAVDLLMEHLAEKKVAA